uniref:Replication-associated protein n=1 Tax=Luscinia sibilans CRESS-DNA-virus sp. TaxID=2815041 RepID=A0A8A4XC36_9VIRU|nr:MAG: replication-associated protein [Luscinia sibilans CRESS-DNA-virus sp.]
MPCLQAVAWIGTARESEWLDSKFADPNYGLTAPLVWLHGQLEVGAGGFRHCQFVAHFSKKLSRKAVTAFFGDLPTTHWEATRSAAADAYVAKSETAVVGSQFEYGARPMRRNNAKDWVAIWDAACAGRIDEIPHSIRVQSYRTLRAIASDFAIAPAMERVCHVYWGPTGTGKSRRAWELAGLDAYPKAPTTKFWDGYQSQEHVVIDEFRGAIEISHILRWLDRYPVLVEIKGSSTVLRAKQIWITSNLHPSQWYVTLDPATYAALERRLTITSFEEYPNKLIQK